MKTHVARRIRFGLLTAAVAAALWGAVVLRDRALRPTSFFTGWTLLGIVLFLSAFGVRKKVPVIPLGTAATWLRVHAWVGILGIVVYGLHTGGRLPQGRLEGTLAALFLVVSASGVIGLFLSRVVPARLARKGQEVIFERIPWHLRDVRRRAETLVLASVAQSNQTTLADFYERRLHRFFARPRNYWHHIAQSNRHARALMTELRDLDRYLNEDERKMSADLLKLVWEKDDLDYHYALQGTLKGWLFVHVPLTCALLVFAALHAFVALAFTGGAP